MFCHFCAARCAQPDKLAATKSKIEESFDELRVRVEDDSRQSRLDVKRLSGQIEDLQSKMDQVIQALSKT